MSFSIWRFSSLFSLRCACAHVAFCPSVECNWYYLSWTWIQVIFASPSLFVRFIPPSMQMFSVSRGCPVLRTFVAVVLFPCLLFLSRQQASKQTKPPESLTLVRNNPELLGGEVIPVSFLFVRLHKEIRLQICSETCLTDGVVCEQNDPFWFSSVGIYTMKFCDQNRNSCNVPKVHLLVSLKLPPYSSPVSQNSFLGLACATGWKIRRLRQITQMEVFRGLGGV